MASLQREGGGAGGGGGGGDGEAVDEEGEKKGREEALHVLKQPHRNGISEIS